MRTTFTVVTLLVGMPLVARARAQDVDYLVFVAAEASDRISLVRFGPQGARIVRDIPIGLMPTDPDGPHGLAVSPDGRFLYVSTAHGSPYGYLWKLDAETGRPVRRVELGSFPATLQVTPDGAFAFVVNFNLHGDMVPSSVSVVATDSMLELARIRTCVMPHGSRLNAQGTKQYSACMMDDLVVEIDTRTFAVARSFRVAKGAEQGFAGLPPAPPSPTAGSHTGHLTPGPRHPTPSCSPTWVQPSADGSKVYVACNKANEILEIDVASWTLGRRLPAGDGVYNLAVTRDGKLLLATNKRGQSLSIFDLATSKEVARLSTLRKIVHGVVISPDDRYAFVSVEGIGAEPGTVEIVDLLTKTRVASVDVGQMAGGIDFWKTEEASDPVQIQRITQVVNSGIGEPRRAVIRSGAAWSAFWTELEKSQDPKARPPSVDFSRDVVIVAAMGQRNSGGHTIEIRDVAEDAGRLIARVVETSPGAGCFLTMALTEPVDVVRVPGKAGRQVEFAESKETQQCS